MLVSVIIPCYNVELYISECLESVFSQSYKDLEIICVDNNSTDRTVEILNEYSLKGKIIFLKETSAGASCARNKGLSVAKGQWIQFLDADDLLLQDKIAHQISLLSANVSSVAFIAGACYKQKTDGIRTTVVPTEKDPFKAIFLTQLGNTCANLFNANSIREIGGWDPKLKSSQESDLMFRLLKKNKDVLFDHVPLTVIRERVSGQISQGDPKKNWLQYINLRIQIVLFLKSKESAYFSIENQFYMQNLFSQVRTLAKYDLKCAAEIFNDNFDKSFKPSSSSLFSVYAFLFFLFGFEKTEKLRRLIYN
ncbi:MAG: glycosyltransferase [Bacteroidia bacterium]|nr:glycosyltransferase [Bacteroidia bacterium]